MYGIRKALGYRIWAIGQRRRKQDPVPMRPRHRRDWSRWGRYCVCGLRWACPDRDGSPLDERFRASNGSDVWDRGLVASPHRNAACAAYRRAVGR